MGSINDDIALLKARVKSHTRKLKSGKRVRVRAHETKTPAAKKREASAITLSAKKPSEMTPREYQRYLDGLRTAEEKKSEAHRKASAEEIDPDIKKIVIAEYKNPKYKYNNPALVKFIVDKLGLGEDDATKIRVGNQIARIRRELEPQGKKWLESILPKMK